MRRALLFLLVMSLFGAACGQSAPDRGSLPTLPEQISFPTTTTTTTVVPEDGSCVVTRGVGLRIDELTEGYEAASVLAVGDVIVAIDGVGVTNQSTLRAELTGRAPGTPVDVGYVRDGTEAAVTVTLGAAPDDPSRGMIGVIVRNHFDVIDPVDIPAGPVEGDRLLVDFDEMLYAVDFDTREWVSLGVPAPDSQIVQIDGTLMVTAPDGSGLVAIDGSRVVELTTDEVSFVAPLGVLGNVLVYSVVGTDASGAVQISEVLASDLGNGELLWRSRPPVLGTTLPVPVVGYPDPSGRFVAVSHQHTDGLRHTVYSEDGTPIVGWGSGAAELVPGAVLAGWLDERRLVAIGRGGDDQFVALIVDPADLESDPVVFALDISDPVSAYAVTGTSKLVIGTEAETFVFDLDLRTFESLTANCGLQIIGRTA